MYQLETLRDLKQQNYSLGLYCLQCDRWAIADLDKLLESGQGELKVTHSRFRCADCGQAAEKQVRPPVPVVSTATPYIVCPLPA